MARKDEPNVVSKEQAPDVEHMKRRLDMLDQRLDNIDSVVTALVERVMNRPITLSLSCSNCGKNIEFAIIAREKPGV